MRVGGAGQQPARPVCPSPFPDRVPGGDERDRLPMVPPDTKVPPAESGQPSRSTIQDRASFSAWMAPHLPPRCLRKMFAALVAKSKAIADRVGAGRDVCEVHGIVLRAVAGMSTRSKTSRAACQPMPSGVTAGPAAATSSTPVGPWSSDRLTGRRVQRPSGVHLGRPGLSPQKDSSAMPTRRIESCERHASSSD